MCDETCRGYHATAGSSVGEGHTAGPGRAPINAELASCEEYGVWDPCDMPRGKTVLPSQSVLDHMRNGRFNARLVTGGDRDQPGRV